MNRIPQALRGVPAARVLASMDRKGLQSAYAGKPSDFLHFGADEKRVALKEAKDDAKRAMDAAHEAIRARGAAFEFADEQEEAMSGYFALQRAYQSAERALKDYDREQNRACAPVYGDGEARS